MKNKGLLIANIVIILFCTILLILHCTNQIELTRKTFMRLGVLLVTYFVGVFRYFSKQGSAGTQKTATTHYAELYKHIIRDAFSRDKAGYRKLMKGIYLYNTNEYDRAIKELTKLRKRCVTSHDTAAVLFFIAKSYKDKKQIQKAIEYYELLLKHDASCSTAWSNLGLIHHEAGRAAEAKYALNQALLYNPENAYAYCNLANVLYRNGEFEAAKNMGLKSLQLNNQLSSSASITALAYASLGDEENARKYCKLYGASQDDKTLVSMIERQLKISKSANGVVK